MRTNVNYIASFGLLLTFLLVSIIALPGFGFTDSENVYDEIPGPYTRYESNAPAGSASYINQQLEYIVDQTWKLRNINPERSIELGLKAIALADSIDDYYHLVKAHSFTGVSYRLMGDYNRAIEFFFKGLELAKQYNIPQQEGYAYINIANLHIYLEFYSQALDNLGPALEIAKRIEDKDMLSYVYLNRGRVLMHLNKPDSAVNDINNALLLRKQLGNIPGQAVCYKYLGDIYYNANDLESAGKNYNLALSTVNKETDKDLWGNLQLQKALIFCKSNDIQNSAPFARRAYEVGREVNSRLLIHGALKVLARVNMKSSEYESAARLLTEMNRYADTLFSQQLSEKMLGMEFQLQQQKQQAEVDIIKKDAEIKSLRLSKQRIVSIALGIFILLLIATAFILLKLLKKLKHANRELTFQKEELKQSNAAKDRMFMVIGHDLRSPIWNLRALIELLKDDDQVSLNSGLRDNFRSLSRAVQSVSDLLENLLFWAKAQDGKMVFKPAPTDMKYLVLKSVQPYRTWAENKNVDIDFTTEDCACMVNADENMIQAVVRNLVSNAIKYSYADSKIEISIKKSGDFSRFSITDFGRGVKPEDMVLIENDAVVHSSKGTGNEPGSGIGLSLCKDFISRHNARLMIESSQEKGTVFWFDLPVLPRPW